MEIIKDSFRTLPKRDPQRYLMRHIETELKELNRAIKAGENSITWLNVQGTAEARELEIYLIQQQKQYNKLLSIALERYEKLINNQPTDEGVKFDTFKSKVKVTKSDL